MIDLHELANMPGAGKATAALKKAGFWDEKLEPVGDGENEYKIKVTGFYEPQPETVTVTVFASSCEEAEELAEDEVDFDEVTDVEIISVKEVE